MSRLSVMDRRSFMRNRSINHNLYFPCARVARQQKVRSKSESKKRGSFLCVFSWEIFFDRRYDWYWPYNLTVALTMKLNALKLLLQVTFCHPPGGQCHDGIAVQPIKFYFTDQTRVGTTAGGENAVVQMIGSLYDCIENDFGSLSTRLYRAFRPKPDKSTTTWKWRRLCCLPYIVIFEFCFCSLLVGISVLTVYLIDISSDE